MACLTKSLFNKFTKQKTRGSLQLHKHTKSSGFLLKQNNKISIEILILLSTYLKVEVCYFAFVFKAFC